MSTRSAHASIKGYFAQLVRAALEWTRLGAGECLVIEGDEDYDRQVLQGTNLLATTLNQHKAIEAAIGWSAEVQRSVLGFISAFAGYHAAGVRCTPMFTSTSGMARTVKTICAWATWATLSETERQELVDAVANDLRNHKLLTEQGEFAQAAKAAVAYLDGKTGWRAFVEATKWEFNAATDEENMKFLKAALEKRSDVDGLPTDVLTARIVIAVVRTACNDQTATRTLTAKDLNDLICAQHSELMQWAEGPDAAHFFELFDLRRLTEVSRQKVEMECQRGTLDQRGGTRVPRPQLEQQLAEATATTVVVGERGTGKTSLVAQWAKQEMDAGRSVIWVTCRDAQADVDSFLREQVGSRLGAALLPILANRAISLVVDALDQGRTQEAREMLVELVERASDANVRTVALVRKVDARSDKRVQRLLRRATPIEVTEFNDAEHEFAIAALGAPAALQTVSLALPTEVAGLVRVPLHAHFVWEIATRATGRSLSPIKSLAELMDQYWTSVVLSGDAAIETTLREFLSRMLQARRLSAKIVDMAGVDVLRRLVRAEVLRHQHIPAFGIDDGEASFSYDAVFDYAVFRLLWRNAKTADVVASLAGCGTFAAGLGRSFRLLLEFVQLVPSRGIDDAVTIAREVYAASAIEQASRERLANEFFAWMSEQDARAAALTKQRRLPGGAELLSRATQAVIGDPP